MKRPVLAHRHHQHPVTRLAAERGIDLTLLTRGQNGRSSRRRPHLTADIADEFALPSPRIRPTTPSSTGSRSPPDTSSVTSASPRRTARLIQRRQCLSAPRRHYLITESTPLQTPIWHTPGQDRLRRPPHAGLSRPWLPITIVRPSLTYGDTQMFRRQQLQKPSPP